MNNSIPACRMILNSQAQIDRVLEIHRNNMIREYQNAVVSASVEKSGLEFEFNQLVKPESWPIRHEDVAIDAALEKMKTQIT